MNKWLVDYTGGSLQVAGVTTGGNLADCSAIGFQVCGITDPEEIACAIENIQAMRNENEGYWNTCTIRTRGNITIYKFSGSNCSIIVNNSRVVYHGAIGRLNGLPKALRKAEMKFNKGCENE